MENLTCKCLQIASVKRMWLVVFRVIMQPYKGHHAHLKVSIQWRSWYSFTVPASCLAFISPARQIFGVGGWRARTEAGGVFCKNTYNYYAIIVALIHKAPNSAMLLNWNNDYVIKLHANTQGYEIYNKFDMVVRTMDCSLVSWWWLRGEATKNKNSYHVSGILLLIFTD